MLKMYKTATWGGNAVIEDEDGEKIEVRDSITAKQISYQLCPILKELGIDKPAKKCEKYKFRVSEVIGIIFAEIRLLRAENNNLRKALAQAEDTLREVSQLDLPY